MNGFERIYAVMSGGSTDRTPFMPKIWVRLACEITGISLVDILADPFLAMACTVRAGLMCDADGARVFRFPKRQTVRDEDGGLLEVSGGVQIGRIDTKGGLSTYLYEDGTMDIGDEYEMTFVQFKKQKSPLVKSITDARRIAVPGKALFKDLGFDSYYKKILAESNGIAIAGDCGSATLSFHSHFRGSAQSLMDFYDEPGLVSAVMDKGVETAVAHGKFCIDSGLRILRLNDSTANMNVISPDIFRDFIKPRFREICDELHSYNKDVRIYCHNCGNILPIMNDLVETGLDCIAPLDPLGGFNCTDARAAVPEGYPLMGGMDTLSFINRTQDEITAEANACIAGAGRNGAFILGTGCVLPPGSDPGLIKAAAAAAHSHRIEYSRDRRIESGKSL